MPLLTISNERIDMKITGIDWSKVNMEEELRGLSDEKKVERMGLVKIIMENNIKMLEMQKTIENIKRQKEKEIRKREEEDNRQRKESCERNEREREKREKQKRVEEEWRKIKKMKIKEERRTENKWKCQEELERRREERRQIVMEERKYFACGGFRHIAYSCRNVGKKGLAQVPSNRFEVLKVRVIQKEEGSGKEVAKDRKKILREERAKRGIKVRQINKKKEKYLREVMVKIRLKQEEEEKGIVTEVLLNSGATGLVMSEEFAKKHRFRKRKLERPVYVRNVDGMLNYVGPTVDTVEVEIFFKGHKERMLIDVIEGQKQSVILGMLWLAHYNPEINWKTGEVQITRCLDECGKKWRTGRQTKPGWKKQEEKKKKKEMKRLTTDEEIAIVKIVAEKEEELDEEDVIVVRKTEEMVPRQFHKYLKVFEKKESERMPMRKAWDYVIDFREGFVPKKGKIYLLSRVEREEVQEFVKDQLRKGYIRPLKSPQTSLVFFVPKKDGNKRMVQDY